MTVEELDIIVQASVEQATKEFKKLLPELKKQLSGIQKEFDRINIKDITAKIDMKSVEKTVKEASKKIKEAFDPEDISGIKISGNFGKEIEGVSNQFKRLSGQKVDLANVIDLSNYKRKLEEAKSMAKENWQEVKSGDKVVSYDTSSIQNFINSYKGVGEEVDKVKGKVSQLKQETSQTATTQNKLGSFFSTFKSKLDQAKTSAKGLKTTFNQIPKITQNITNNVKNITTKMKQGLGHVLRYAAALFSLRSIYTTLSSSAQSWLSSQNAQAQQLSANIEYMKYAMR